MYAGDGYINSAAWLKGKVGSNFFFFFTCFVV